MLTFLLILALIGTLLLVFHISVEINGVEKKVGDLATTIRKHYERKQAA